MRHTRFILVGIVLMTVQPSSTASPTASSTEPANKFAQACTEIKQHNCERARTLLTELAQKGDRKSEVLLGMMYEKGAGVKKDVKQAEGWFSKAARQGELEGQSRLGMLLVTDPKFKKRQKEAVRWLHLAADRGSDAAMRQLEKMPRLKNALDARRARAQNRNSRVSQGAKDIKTSWKGYSSLAKAIDEVAAAAASPQ